jgi:GT2 family glycosyltransferase
VPEAIVHHHYSATAGRVSPLKVYYVERNRLFVLLKNFPLRMLLGAPTATLERYFWHAMAMGSGDSAAARFRRANSPWQLVFILARAHLALLKYGPGLWRQRKRIRRHARLTVGEFSALCERFAISPRQVATQ